MKRTKCNSIIIIAIIVVIVGTISVYLLTRPKLLGNMSHNCSEQTTATSNISFVGEAGDRIKFSLRSDVENGELIIILYDSAGSEVYMLDKAKELEAFYILSSADTYTLAAEYSSFVGSFNVRVYEAN